MLICASIILPLTAYAAGNEMHNAAALAGMHCQLWLRQLQELPPPSHIKEYQQMIGQKLPSAQVAKIHIATQGLPDFGFILGARWDVATLRERTDFNRLFIPFLTRAYGLGTQQKGDYCRLDVALTPQDPTENNDIFVELPQPRLLQARVQTVLPPQLPVTYSLTQDLIGWQITEITVNGTALRKKYGADFNARVAQGGYAALIMHLTHK